MPAQSDDTLDFGPPNDCNLDWCHDEFTECSSFAEHRGFSSCPNEPASRSKSLRKNTTANHGDIIAALAGFFHRNGYVRQQNADRLAAEGHTRYKKGDEIRLVTDTKAELAEIRRLLRATGFKFGRPFRKSNQYRQPIYGRTQVARFLAFIGHQAGTTDMTARKRNLDETERRS